MQPSLSLISQPVSGLTPILVVPEELNPQLRASYARQSYAILNQYGTHFLEKLTSVALRAFTVSASLVGDSNTLASIFRKLDRHVIKGIESLAKVPGQLSPLALKIRHAVGLIDFVQLFNDLDYFYNSKFEKDRIFSILSKCSVTIADTGGVLLWLEEMKFMNLTSISQSMAEIRVFNFVPKVVESVSKLSKVGPLPVLTRLAAKIGEIRVFSFMTKISMLFVATRALTLTYVFLAADSVHRLIRPGTAVQKTQASLDLALYLTELALDALMTIGVTNLAVMGLSGVGAITLVIASFAYKVLHASELKAAQQIYK